MKTDLDHRAAIEKMVDLFYEKVRGDSVIGPFFNEVVKVDWSKHLPKMYDFWESILLGSSTYTGNPIQVHQHISDKSPLRKEHFDHWVKLFHENLDANFEGPKTELARQRAMSIAMVMGLKVI